MTINPGLGVTPSLDYLVQYPVKKVLVKEDESGYAIELDGGAIIGVEIDEDTEVPHGLEGLALLTAIYGAEDTRLRFGRVQVVSGETRISDEVYVTVLPGHYFIADPRFEGDLFYPQTSKQETDRPPTIADQFAERAAEAPESPAEGLEGVEGAQAEGEPSEGS